VDDIWWEIHVLCFDNKIDQIIADFSHLLLPLLCFPQHANNWTMLIRPALQRFVNRTSMTFLRGHTYNQFKVPHDLCQEK
jgi:hypothetical protein